MCEITQKPALLPQGEFYYLASYNEQLFLVAQDDNKMIIASQIGACNCFAEPVAVPRAFAELLKIVSYPITISAGNRVEYTSGNNRGSFVSPPAPAFLLRSLSEQRARKIDGEKLTLGIRLALSPFPVSDDKTIFYITPREIVATDRIALAVVQHELPIEETLFMLPSHAIAIPATTDAYSLIDNHLVLQGPGVICNIPLIRGKAFDTAQFDASPQFSVPRREIATAVGIMRVIAVSAPHTTRVEIEDDKITLSAVWNGNTAQSQVDSISIQNDAGDERRELYYSAHYLGAFLQALYSAETVFLSVYDNDIIQVTANVEGMRVRYVLPPLRLNQPDER